MDLSSEMSEKDLRSTEGYEEYLKIIVTKYQFYFNREYYVRLFHIKRAIRMFVNLKSQMNFKHEYALMLLQETAFWVYHQPFFFF